MSVTQANKSSKPRRDSNLELFRIILMLAIIAHHYVMNTDLGFVASQNPNCIRSFLIALLGVWGKAGINCFLMITGYFMCKSHITLEKFLRLFFEFLFYDVVIGVVLCISGYVPFNISALADLFLPLKGMAKNFTICFLFFFLCIPFLNIVLKNISRRMHGGLLVLLLLFYTVVPSCRFQWSVQFNYVTWFCVVYMLAAYIRMYPGKWSEGAAKWGGISFAILVVASFSVYTNSSFFLIDCNKILAVATAVVLFLFFKNFRITYNPIINWTAQSIFGVLLIHNHSGAMRKWLWEDTLHVGDMFNSPWLWLHAVCSQCPRRFHCLHIDRPSANNIHRETFF